MAGTGPRDKIVFRVDTIPALIALVDKEIQTSVTMREL